MRVRIDRKRDWTKDGPEQVFVAATCAFGPGGFVRRNIGGVLMHFAGIECPDVNFKIPDKPVPEFQYVYPGDTVIYWKDGISYWNEVNTESDAIALCNEMSFLAELEKADDV